MRGRHPLSVRDLAIPNYGRGPFVARVKTASPSVGCDRQIATAIRFGIWRSRTTDVGRSLRGCHPRPLIRRLRSPDRNMRGHYPRPLIRRLRSPDRNHYPFGIRRSRTTNVGRSLRGCHPRLLIRRLRSPDRNHARASPASPSVGCDRQIATVIRSGSGDPELRTLASSVGCDRQIATITRSGSGDPELQFL